MSAHPRQVTRWGLREAMEGRRLQITVDYTRCVGSRVCVLTAHRVFALNEDRQSYVVDPRGDTPDRILAAAEGCPMMAITVTDAETGEQLFPPVQDDRG